VPYRTELTSPPDVEPTPVTDTGSREWYSPALAVPREPRVPSRRRRAYALVIALLAVAALAAVIVPALQAGMDEDPALIEGGRPLATGPVTLIGV
jgi:hypothetical protein